MHGRRHTPLQAPAGRQRGRLGLCRTASPHLRNDRFANDLNGTQDVHLGLDDEAHQHMRDAELPKLLEVFDTILRASDDQDIQGIAAGIQGLETARMFDP
jgi:hypothetical protein